MYYSKSLTRKYFKEIWAIYEDSFPEDERRNLEEQENILNNPLFEIIPFVVNDKLTGFCTVWKFTNFLYVEHAAIKKEYRGRGFGREMYLDLINKFPGKIVLEVEHPSDDLKKRRISFYERLGFELNSYNYIQPPFSRNKNSVPLLIMSYPNLITDTEFNEIRKTIYNNVFGIETIK